MVLHLPPLKDDMMVPLSKITVLKLGRVIALSKIP